jgi:protease-4
MKSNILLCAFILLLGLPIPRAHAAGTPASFIDKKLIFSVAGGAAITFLVVSYMKLRSMLSYAGNTPIGVVNIQELTDASVYLQQLQEYARNPMIKGILLQVNSSGGAAGTAYILHHELLRIKRKKPIIAMIENGCYSGGYWVASAADYIIAAATANVGSIGVISARSYFATPQRYELDGMTALTSGQAVDDSLFAGQYKPIAARNRALTDAERVMLQKVVDGTYDHVCADIAAARNLNLAERQNWADGQIFTAVQALPLNLIDQVGSVSDIRLVMRQLLRNRNIPLEGELIFVQKQNLLSFLNKAPLLFNGVQMRTQLMTEHPYQQLTEL